MFHECYLYGVSRGEPYFQIDINADDEGIAIMKKFMNVCREEAIHALEENNSKKALSILHLWGKAEECVDELKASKDDAGQ